MLARGTWFALLATATGLVLLRDEQTVYNNSAVTCTKHSLSPLLEGGYIVAWLEESGGVKEVKGRRFNNNGLELDTTPLTLASGTDPDTLCVRGTQANFIGIVTTNDTDITSIRLTSDGDLGDTPKVESFPVGTLGIADPACSAVFGPSSLSVLFPQSPSGLSAFVQISFLPSVSETVDTNTLYQSLATERNQATGSYVMAYSSTGEGLVIRKQNVVDPGPPETMNMGGFSGDVRLATLADAGRTVRVAALVDEGVAYAQVFPTLTPFELLVSDTTATNPTIACSADTTCLYSFELATGEIVGLFDAADTGLTEQVTIAATGTGSIELGPKSTMINSDDMLVVWNHAGDGNSCDLRSRIVNYVPPTSAPPTNAPPTSSPPTSAPPTDAPPTSSPPTSAPPTDGPPSSSPPTLAPSTTAPATEVPRTVAPETQVPSSAPPTTTPSQAPATDIPSQAPPTLVPTDAPPTAAPPTLAPTDAPPTFAPTDVPPTFAPTNAPTSIPTDVVGAGAGDDDDQMGNVGRGLLTGAAAIALILLGVGFFVYQGRGSPTQATNEPAAP
ncbi:hypothetical protein DIPPA_55269 [Diplonema papillatum]|nr:hypothetical protein DIPPA_55269 [Diplonema papillatum]KAJ9452898.1 hypothetical protein DIPPA_55269 [Diplonema papillatum]